MNMIDLCGQRFGRLLVMCEADPHYTKSGHKVRKWHCVCDCGEKKKFFQAALRGGKAKSCGCLHKEIVTRPNKKSTTHGLSDHPLYGIWKMILRRCENPNDKGFHKYGGRGIKVCERWHNPQNFINDIGVRPSTSHSIDRIDNDGNYEPGNCRWATPKQQARNSRNNHIVLWKGERMSLAKACEIENVHYPTVSTRINNLGWDIEKTLLKPVDTRCRNGKSKRI